jgi:hypothetical protein
MFHYNADSTDGVVPGTSIKVIALNGLNASKQLRLENLICSLVVI